MKNNNLIKKAIILIFSVIIVLTAIVITAEAGPVKSHMSFPVDTPLVLNIRFTSSPENAEKFKKVLTELFKTISKEPNFISASIHQELGKPNEFLVYEVWNDNIQHFLTVQMKKDYAVKFEQTLKDMNVQRDPKAYASFGNFKGRIQN